MPAGMYAGPGKERIAWNQVLTSDMIFTQPVNLRIRAYPGENAIADRRRRSADSETSRQKNSQPFVWGNVSRGCLTIASKGTSCRMP